MIDVVVIEFVIAAILLVIVVIFCLVCVPVCLDMHCLCSSGTQKLTGTRAPL